MLKNIKSTIIISTILTMLIIPISVSAQDEQNSDDQVATEDIKKEAITQKLKERLDEVVQGEKNIESSPSAIKQPQSKYSAYFGTIKEATNSTLLIETEDGNSNKVTLSTKTKINLYTQGKGNKQIDLEEIETGLFAIAMGTLDNNKVINALRITLSQPEEDKIEKKVLFGKITEIDQETITISDTTIDIPKKYSIQIQGVEEPEIDDISINDKSVAIIEIEKSTDKNNKETTSNTLLAIYISPSMKNPLAETNQIIEEATSAAESTPSAKKE